MPPKKSRMELNPFLRGVMYGMHLAGMTFREIADEIEKPDGQHPAQQSVSSVVQIAEANGGMAWDGQRAEVPGRPRVTTDALDRGILKLVYRYRWSSMVTVKFIKKHLPSARTVSDATIARRCQP